MILLKPELHCKMKNYLIFSVFAVFNLNIFSQTTISGTVSQQNGGSLPGASIYLQGTYDGVTSDTSGRFSFKTLKTGKYVVSVTFMGFEPFSKEIVLNGSPVNIVVGLKETFNQINAVTITAGTFEAGDKKQANILTPLDMITTAGAEGDVYGALQTLPGTTTNGESGKLFVKGGDSEESQTYIDGSLVYAPYSSSAPNMSVRGRFNPFMFKGTIFSTGGYSAEYGQALSSVLLLNTNDMPAEEQLDLSVMSIGLGVAGTKLWKTGALTTTISYNNLGPYMWLFPQNYRWVRYPESTEGAISLRQKTGKTGMFKLYSSYGNSRYTIEQEDLNQEGIFNDYALRNDNYFLNASWKSSLGKKWNIASSASFTNNMDDVGYNTISFKKLLRGGHVKNVFSHHFGDMITLRAGAEFFTRSYLQKYLISGNVIRNIYTNNTFSAFAEAELYASAKFVTRLGTRIEYSDYLQRANLVPRISAAYKLTESSQFSMAYGWFYQNPSDDYLVYTSKLGYERADHYTFSYQASQNDRTFRAEIYYKDYKSLAKLNGNAFYLPASYSNTGDGYAAGLDVFWRDRKTIKNGDYWVSYSYLDTRRNYRNYPTEAVPGFASKHNFAAVYKHWFGGMRSYLSANLKYSSPRVYNNPNSEIFNGEHTRPYRSVDISWSFLYKPNIILYAAVTNIFGFKQGYGNTYASVQNSEGIYRSAPIIPGADRFFLVACFITLTRKGEANQMDKIE
ncbi:MAG: TonB-dependent receptor [Bacteroidetes bacterium]|nr:MAG: TonB-dependent receptor [Bacteroidota bacterium]